jgi:hypothetical protein
MRTKTEQSQNGEEMINRYSLVIGLFILICFVSGCAITYKFDSYQGKVIDAKTKQPIEGAAVLVVYYSETYWLAGTNSHYVDAQEVLTDKNGEFKIPAKRAVTFRIIGGWDRHPQFTIFKPGYGCYPKHKDVTPVFDYGSLPTNHYVTIELPQLKTREERMDMPSLNFAIPYEKQQGFVELVNQEMEQLGATGKYTRESFGRKHP